MLKPFLTLATLIYADAIALGYYAGKPESFVFAGLALITLPFFMYTGTR